MASEHDAWENYATLLARCEQAEKDRDSLVARILRDGGEFQQRHGTEKAVSVAHTIVANRIVELEEAEATVAACKADAERYRFLRSVMYQNDVFEIGESYLRWKVVGACPEPHEWDAAIDAARTAAESAGGGTSDKD